MGVFWYTFAMVKIPSGKFLLDASIHAPKKPNGVLAVLLPGYIDTKDYQHLVLLGDDLVKKGYLVIRFDPAGMWHSSGSEKDYTMTQYFRDVRSVIAWAKKRKMFPNGIVLIGHSLGGRIALLSSVNISQVKAVVALMPPKEFTSSSTTRGKEIRKRWLTSGVRHSRRDVPGKKTSRYFAVPVHILRDAERYDNDAHFKKISVPTLFLAGEKDPVVPVRLARSLYRILPGPKTFRIVKGLDHDFRHHKKEIAIVNRQVLDFLGTIVPQKKEGK